MNFFYELAKKTTEKTTNVGRKTNLKIKIAEDKMKIEDLYEEIGKKIYENHVRENKVDDEKIIREYCFKIDLISKEIEEARKEILELNNMKMCKKCFAQIEVDDMFCCKCGEKQTEEKTVFERAEEKLEKSEILQHNKNEAKIVKEELKNKNNKNN